MKHRKERKQHPRNGATCWCAAYFFPHRHTHKCESAVPIDRDDEPYDDSEERLDNRDRARDINLTWGTK